MATPLRVFTITPGRSGIHWLSAVFRNCTDLPKTGYWEPFKMKSLSREQRKLVVRKTMDDMPAQYVSTTLHPKNGWLRILFEECSAKFIHLKRDVFMNARSWHRMNGIPGRSMRGKLYHSNPESLENCLNVHNFESVSDFRLCVWQCNEVRARAEYMKKLGADVYEVDIEDLNYPEKVWNLLEWVGVSYDKCGVNEINPASRHTIQQIPEDARRMDIGYLCDEMTDEEMRADFKGAESCFCLNPKVDNVDV